jgi:hypothetical protein
MFQPRWTPGKYRDCRFCSGRGCACCDSEADKDYKRAFPNGPQPIATFKTDSPEDMDLARRSIGREALESAFGPGGGGMADIIHNLQAVGKYTPDCNPPQTE